MRLPSLRAIQAFDAVARHGSFSRAADELAVTHGAVSQQVRNLEEQLETKLFLRTARGAELTDDGRLFFQYSRDAFATLVSGVADLKRRSKDTTISVSLTTAVALKWVIPRLPEFREKHPDIAVLLDTSDRLVDFREETTDVALRFGKGDWKGLHVSLLVEEQLVAAASPELVGDRKLPLDAETLLEMPLLHDEYNPGWQKWFEASGLQHIPSNLPGPHIGDTGVIIAAALDCQGVALVRHLLAADDLAAGRLVQVNEMTLPLENSLYFVCRMGDQDRSAVRAFRDWLIGTLTPTGKNSRNT